MMTSRRSSLGRLFFLVITRNLAVALQLVRTRPPQADAYAGPLTPWPAVERRVEMAWSRSGIYEGGVLSSSPGLSSSAVLTRSPRCWARFSHSLTTSVTRERNSGGRFLTRT